MLNSLFRLRSTPKVNSISPKQLAQRLKAGEDLLVLDVRNADEYGRGHIAGSRLMPLHTLSNRFQELTSDKAVICVCRSGSRSKVACEILTAQGFTNVTNLSGGMIKWRLSGLAVK